MNRIPALALALTVATSPSWAEDVVVLESSLAAFAPGVTLKGDQPIKLPEKSRLVLVTETGRTVTMMGPFDGLPAAEKGVGDGGRLTTALATLVRTSQEEANSVGAVRAASIRTRADALRVNLSESGDYCVVAPAGLEITRYQSEMGAGVTVNAVKGDKKTSFAWPSGATHLPWPTDMIPEDGATYLVGQADKDSLTMIVLHMVSDTAPTDAHRAVFMAEKGCIEQAKMLLALLKRGEN